MADPLSQLVLVDQIHYSTLDKERGPWPIRTKENTEEKTKYAGHYLLLHITILKLLTLLKKA